MKKKEKKSYAKKERKKRNWWNWCWNIAPQLWNDQYSPKNPSPWFLIGLCYLACISLLIFMRVYLATQNLNREILQDDLSFKSQTLDHSLSKDLRSKLVPSTSSISDLNSNTFIFNSRSHTCSNDLTDLEDPGM